MIGIRQSSSRRTLFIRMLTTYVVLTIMTSTIIGISSLFIYEHFYTASINESVRQNIEHNHQSEVREINDIKNDIIGDIFMLQYNSVPLLLNADLIGESYVSIKRIYDYLNQLAMENSPYVNSIHFYYKRTRTLISSKYGLKYLDHHNGSGIDTDWIDQMMQGDNQNIWIPTREVPFTSSPDSLTESNFSFATTYPMTRGSQKAEIMVCIDFNETIVNRHLNSYSQGSNYILDSKGMMISPDSLPQGYVFDERVLRDIDGYFLESTDGEPYLVSYIREPINGWILLNRHKTDSLYKTINTIKWLIILIYSLTTSIGIGASYLIARRLYNPVKNLMTLIRSYDDSEPIESDSEYKRIGRVINGLGGHVDELQETIDSSRSLLVSKLITDLALKRGLEKREIDDRLKFLDISLDKSEFRFMKVDICFTDAEELQPSQAQIIKYKLISRLNLMNDDDNRLVVTDYDENSILVLINTNQNTEALAKSKLRELATIENIYSAEIFIRIFLTDPVLEMEFLYRSYRQIGAMKPMLFYFPARQVLTSEVIVPESAESAIDPGRLTKLEQILYGGKEEIYGEINSIIEEVVKPLYSLGEKQRVLIKVMNSIIKYMKDVSINTKGILDENVYGTFESFEDINMFRSWVTDVIEKVYEMLNDTISSASHDTILKIKSYIEDHIEKDLSLSLVAEKVNLSPQYLSSLFKKDEGVNFSTYIQHQKMKKAKILLIETNDNIEEVGVRVGYNTSHYFIKKFKETTGFTPKQFRSRNNSLGE